MTLWGYQGSWLIWGGWGLAYRRRKNCVKQLNSLQAFGDIVCYVSYIYDSGVGVSLWSIYSLGKIPFRHPYPPSPPPTFYPSPSTPKQPPQPPSQTNSLHPALLDIFLLSSQLKVTKVENLKLCYLEWKQLYFQKGHLYLYNNIGENAIFLAVHTTGPICPPSPSCKL